MGRGRITVTPGFLFLMAWCNYADQQGLLLPALAGCALHELGHLAAIWGLGGSVRRLRLTAVGAEIQLERPMSYPGELRTEEYDCFRDYLNGHVMKNVF